MALEPGDPGYLEETKQPMLYAVTYAMLAFATIVFGLRMYCRIFVSKRVQLFDWIMMAAFVDIVVMSAMIHMQIKTGMGRHVEYSNRHPGLHVLSMKVGYVQNICYQSSLGLIKSSVLTQYYSIASSRLQKRIIIGVLCFVLLFSAYTTISAILLCLPITNTWNLDTFPEGCWNTATVNFITSGINTGTDVVIYILPIPVLARLKIDRRRKAVLIGTFSVAFFAVGAGLARLSSLVAWTNAGDLTYVASTIPIWDAVETDIAIAAVSLGFIQPLFKASFEGASNIYSSMRSRSRKKSITLAGMESSHKPSVGESSMTALKTPDPYYFNSIMMTHSVEVDGEKSPTSVQTEGRNQDTHRADVSWTPFSGQEQDGRHPSPEEVV